MPVAPTYPGVYIEEIASGVRTITGVPTSVTAFVGLAARGPVSDPQFITSYADYERQFGQLGADNPMAYSVFQYYQNGGSLAIVVRIIGANPLAATINVDEKFMLRATSPGTWGNNLRARVDYTDIAGTDAYNLTIRDIATGEQERFSNISIGANPARRLDRVLESSTLVRAVFPPPAASPPDPPPPVFNVRPAINDNPAAGVDPFDAGDGSNFFERASGGTNGAAIIDANIIGDEVGKTGMYSLLKTDIFNMLVFPPLALAELNANPTLVSDKVLSPALTLCSGRRAMLLVDAPAWKTIQAAVDGIGDFVLSGESSKNAALYFPFLRVPDPDPAQRGRKIDMPPAGAIAGIYARTDVQRGVWKAPAGTDASFNGVPELSLKITDLENGRLNPLAVNCLRSFPIYGRLVWGARTLRGADKLADDWKYVPVRRLALFIEESLFRGTKWVVFEPNDEPLWAQIRLNVGAFMQNLFRQGAFQGSSPREAYFVRCDKTTTTQNHINLGIVNIHVGFAPLKPAEFVIIKIQQMAGQVET
jgi:phage tail sheath protein FI